jgi:hypothetical protein
MVSDSFDKIGQSANINQLELFKLAESVKDVDFKDENVIRNLVNEISAIANVSVPKEKEDQIVEAIVNGHIPLDLTTLATIFKY